MNKAMKQNNACDHSALYESLKRMKISATARRIGEFMVEKLGYDYAVMVFQLKTALGIRPEKIESALQELIDQRFVRQQPRIDFQRNYILDRGFLAHETRHSEPGMFDDLDAPTTPTVKRPQLRVILGGKL